MDLSKLPRMSNTPRTEGPVEEKAGGSTGEPAQPSYSEPQAPPRDYRSTQPVMETDVGAEVWLSLVLGVICMLMGRRFAGWLITTATGGAYQTNVTWTSGPNAGQPVAYFDLTGYTAWTEMAMFLFGLALVLEGAALLATARASQTMRMLVTGMALVVTVAATLFNLTLALFLFSAGAGLPLFSLLATAFGGYMSVYLFRLFASLRQLNAPQRL